MALPKTAVIKPKLAVWKFASCDGCQLSLLDCEAELLTLADRVTIANFPEASRAVIDGPYDISLVEGSITTPADRERIQAVRAQSRYLITLGACATAGGIQALRNFTDVETYKQIVYARPDFIDTLATATPIAEHVKVNFELHGCPISKQQLLELISALLADRKPKISNHSVCIDCKQRGTPCVLVTTNTPCLGPVTRTGCDALCPAFQRGCYGCFGPVAEPNLTALDQQFAERGIPAAERQRLLRTFNAAAPELVTMIPMKNAAAGVEP